MRSKTSGKWGAHRHCVDRSGESEPVHTRGGATVESAFFDRRRARCYAFESIPQLGVAAGLLVDREVAFEHAAIDAKGFDAGLDILAPRRGKVFGGWRHLGLVEIEAERGHADAAELDIDVRALCQLGDISLPAGEDFLPAAGIGANAEHAADMVEDDRRVGERAGEVDRVRQLRVILPGIEAEPQRRELREALAGFGVAHEMRRNKAGSEYLDRFAGGP